MTMSNKINSLTIDGVTYDIDTYNIFNVLDYGCIGDGDFDNFTNIQAIFDNIYNSRKGGVVYFPIGKYNISHGVVIPENTIVIGEGYGSFLYGTDSISLGGVFLGAAGSNITIKNIRVGHNGDYRQFINGSNQGAMGFAPYSYKTAKMIMNDKMIDPNTTYGNYQNLTIENIYSDSTYPLQVEGIQKGGSWTGITYRNIYAPNGCVSFALNRDYSLENITIDNVTCTYLRCGWGYKCDNVNVTNCRVNAFKVGVENLKANNIFVDCNPSARYFSWEDYNKVTAPVVALGGKNCILTNIVIDRHNNEQRCIQYNSDINISNLIIYNSIGDEYAIVSIGNKKITGSNIISDGKCAVLGTVINSKIENNTERINKISDFEIPKITFTGEFGGATANFTNHLYVKDDMLYLKVHYSSGDTTPVNMSLFTINDINLRPKTTKQIPCTIWDSTRQLSHLGWFTFNSSGEVTLYASGGLFTGRNYLMCDGFIHLG